MTQRKDLEEDVARRPRPRIRKETFPCEGGLWGFRVGMFYQGGEPGFDLYVDLKARAGPNDIDHWTRGAGRTGRYLRRDRYSVIQVIDERAPGGTQHYFFAASDLPVHRADRKVFRSAVSFNQIRHCAYGSLKEALSKTAES